MDFEALSPANWIPVLLVALVFAVAAIVLAVGSIGSGQYHDPEAAKFAMMRSDAHPEDPDA
jgi:nitrogen fixation-related uncharacterized protein